MCAQSLQDSYRCVEVLGLLAGVAPTPRRDEQFMQRERGRMGHAHLDALKRRRDRALRQHIQEAQGLVR